MQVRIETTLKGGEEMEKLISTSTNNIALNATSDVELQNALKESLKTVSAGKVTPVTERNHVSNQGLSVKADQYVVQNAGKLAKVSMYVAAVLATPTSPFSILFITSSLYISTAFIPPLL